MATANPTGTRTYPAERHTAASTTTRTEKGMSFAKGPALILGTILLAVGLYLLYKARTFPPFSNFPNGDVTKDGDYIFGLFGANGWTAMLTAVGGGLLLFGAAQHLLAKTMSLIVGIALGAAAVIALVSGNVLGMAAANGWTKLGWAICAVILLFNTLAPRRRRTVVVADEAVAHDAPAYERRPVAAEDRAVADEPTVAHRTAGEPGVVRDPAERNVARDEAGEPTAVHREGEDPNVVRNGEDPNVVRNGEDPNVVRNGEDPNVVRNGEDPNVVRNGEDPTVVRNDEPAARAETRPD